MTTRLAYLGPAGSYAEQAAVDYDATARLVPFVSIPAVASAVRSGLADEGVVPIENSLEGSVTFTLDLLIGETDLFVRNELVIPIDHCLVVVAGTDMEAIRAVYSHPQALAQCRSFLDRCFPAAEQMASLSTSAAVEQMRSSDVPAAAIANRRAASLYDAQIIATGIQDRPNNQTRFVILAPSDHAPTGHDKTSICFSFTEDSPGMMYSVLYEIAKRQINMTKIESRPTGETLGRYIFLIDIEGHREDAIVKDALSEIRSQVSMFRVFGSYPTTPPTA